MPSAHPNPLLEVPFLPGIRQDLDPHVAPIGTLSDAKNVRYRRQGAIHPRAGTRRIDSTTFGTAHELTAAESAAGFVGSRGAAGLLGLDGAAMLWDGSSQWLYGGAYSTALPRQRRNGLVTETNGGYARPGYRPAIATLGSTLLVAASDTVEVHWRVETADGLVLATGVRTGTVCSAVAVGSTYYLLIQNGTTLSALPIVISGSTATQGSLTPIATLASSTAAWDASSYDSTHWFFVHRDGAGTISIRRMSGTTATHTVAASPYSGTLYLSIWADTDNDLVWVGYYDDALVTGTVGYRVHSAANAATVLGNQTIVAATGRGVPLFGPYPDAPNTAFYVNQRSASGAPYVVGVEPGIADSSGSGDRFTVVWHVLPLTKPDRYRRVWCETSDNIAGTSSSFGFGFRTSRCVLLRFWDDAAVGANTPPVLELATEPVENVSSGPGIDEFHAIATASDRHYVVVPRLLRSGGLFSADVLEYETADQAPHRAIVELPQTALVTGQPVELFGDSSPIVGGVEARMGGGAEVGFALEPAVLTAAAANGSGALTSSAQYSWMFVFEWLDPYGRRHRSGASYVYTTTLGASDDEVAFTLSSLDWSQRIVYEPTLSTSPSVVIHAYRTQANRSSPFNRVTPAFGAPLAYTGTGTVTWTDRASDASIADEEAIYVDGGVLDNVLAPSARYVAANDERTLLGGLWTSNVVQFSKIRVPGEPEQYADSDAFRVVLRGACTGVAYQDGSWLAFTETTVSIITGDGPDDQGIGSFFVRTIATDRGCVDGRSVLETAPGVIYRSRRGFELIPRGNGLPMFVGKEVQTLTRQYATVLGAVNHVSDHERVALFLLSDGSNQIVLALDLDLTQELGRGVWSYDTHTALGLGMQAIGRWPTGTFVAVSDINDSDDLAGFLYDETPTYGSDLSNTATLESAVETTHLRPAGLVGQWRCCTVNALFTNCDGGAAVLTLGNDGAASTIGSWTLPNTPTVAVYRTAAPQNAVCTSAKLRLAITRTGSVFGPNLHGLTIERQPVDGARRTASGER